MSIEPDRERIVEQLSAHFAEDHLSTQELEQRFERAYKARTLAELEDAVSGLPALRQPVHKPKPVARAAPPVRASEGKPRRYMAVMSTFRRDGDWTPNRTSEIRAVMAEVKIDLREATFVDREIELDFFAFMADVQILVPPGVRVECDGFAFMGEFSGRHDESPTDPDAPTVRVVGTAVMAQVIVETRIPGESKSAARKRRKLLGIGDR